MNFMYQHHICRSIYINYGLVMDQGPVSREFRELFGPEKVVVKLQSACFEKLIFLHVFNMRKIKRIAKFEGSEPRRCEDIKGIVVPEIGTKSFGSFEKQAPAPSWPDISTGGARHRLLRDPGSNLVQAFPVTKKVALKSCDDHTSKYQICFDKQLKSERSAGEKILVFFQCEIPNFAKLLTFHAKNATCKSHLEQ